MPQELTSLSALADLPFDDIIDVRAPAEFAEDHIPGAISLPVLSDEERARVGTIYVQQDRFLARKIGAALVSRNAANHLEGPLSGKPGGWRPLVYCWRGGQRSGSFTSILAQIGWRADTIAGGYKTYRRLVVKAVYDTPIAPEVILIDGGTGTAKTRLLHHLQQAGAQVLDLEGMAAHRGSLFGLMGESQPSQKMFESGLAMALTGMDPDRPVYVEAESNKIGKIIIPPSLWSAMIGARRVRINAPLAARSTYLVSAYSDLLENPAKLDATLQKLVHYHGHAQVEIWRNLAKAGEYRDLAAELVTTHYDPRYCSISKRHETPAATLEMADLSDSTLAATAARVLALTAQ